MFSSSVSCHFLVIILQFCWGGKKRNPFTMWWKELGAVQWFRYMPREFWGANHLWMPVPLTIHCSWPFCLGAILLQEKKWFLYAVSEVFWALNLLWDGERTEKWRFWDIHSSFIRRLGNRVPPEWLSAELGAGEEVGIQEDPLCKDKGNLLTKGCLKKWLHYTPLCLAGCE